MPLDGGVFLSIVVNARAHDDDGEPTYRPIDRGTFEGITQIGLGVRARLPLRVFVLAGPGDGSRLVIDVAHRW